MLRKEMEDYMAKIVKTDMQEEALKVIKENLKVLAGINAVFNSEEEKSNITIVSGERKVTLIIEKASRNNILKEIRKKIVVQTKGLAKRNAIRLDEEDMTILENREGRHLNIDEPMKDKENALEIGAKILNKSEELETEVREKQIGD
jgi:hypothetical protein